ncbi:hypothetical protein HRbin30_01846 [bacterium HR30]|nr:hypothetical protein HRbin30_01846 [bacterium HR30]
MAMRPCFRRHQRAQGFAPGYPRVTGFVSPCPFWGVQILECGSHAAACGPKARRETTAGDHDTRARTRCGRGRPRCQGVVWHPVGMPAKAWLSHSIFTPILRIWTVRRESLVVFSGCTGAGGNHGRTARAPLFPPARTFPVVTTTPPADGRGAWPCRGAWQCALVSADTNVPRDLPPATHA